MDKEWNLFCQTVDKTHYDKTFELREKLVNQENVSEESLPILKVNTSDLYHKGFQFQDVAKYDFSVENLNRLEADERNLNQNLDNQVNLDAFIQTANDVAKQLKEKYQDGWNAPSSE